MAFIVGKLVGALFVGGLCGVAPLAVGISKGRRTFGVRSLVACVAAGALFGVLGAAPMALVLTVVLLLGPPGSTAASPRADQNSITSNRG